MANRLARESSPYLLLHAENPVDWYPWGEEAFARARAEDKPIFLSVGYSTCYWCHVMERECFSDPEIARADERRLRLHQARPGGAARSRRDLHGRHPAPHALRRLAELAVPHPRPEAVLRGNVLPAPRRHGPARLPARARVAPRGVGASARRGAASRPRRSRRRCGEHLAAARRRARAVPERDARRLRRRRRSRPASTRAGAASAARPKFPSPSNLVLPARSGRRRDEAARRCWSRTLDHMARGGIHDQLAGGFHRYSTDAQWLVPHFEKMLYDNAALARLYAEADAARAGARLRARGASHPRLRARGADRAPRRLPLRDRRGDRRPRGRLLHLDARRSSKARCRRRSDALLSRRLRLRRAAHLRARPLRPAPAAAPRRARAERGRLGRRAAAPARAAAARALLAARDRSASGRSWTTRSWPTGTA